MSEVTSIRDPQANPLLTPQNTVRRSTPLRRGNRFVGELPGSWPTLLEADQQMPEKPRASRDLRCGVCGMKPATAFGGDTTLHSTCRKAGGDREQKGDGHAICE